MTHLRGGTHTTLTETATEVVVVLERIPGITRISPGVIRKNGKRSGNRYITALFTRAGMELIISGQGAQKVAVHCAPADTFRIFTEMSTHKRLSAFSFKHRTKKPGI